MLKEFASLALASVMILLPGKTAFSQTAVTEDMVYVPSGEFIMGIDGEESKLGPAQSVYVNAFYIDKYEVTNARYKEFVDAVGYTPLPDNWVDGTYPEGKADHPVAYVNWYDAEAYCEWAGKRLPTEAEWEKTARGTDGRAFPWGEDWNEGTMSNSAGGTHNDTVPVGSYPEGTSPYGALDMSGNVWEWVQDWFALYTVPYSVSETGDKKVVRGGSWQTRHETDVRCGFRSYTDPNTKIAGIGFRCALSAITPVHGYEAESVPTGFELLQNFPNPFNPATVIEFRLPGESAVSLTVYDTMGRTVRHLFEGKVAGGWHRFVWDGRDDIGRESGSGVYIYRLSTTGGSTVRKMVLAR